jgi:hypothetical protein
MVARLKLKGIDGRAPPGVDRGLEGWGFGCEWWGVGCAFARAYAPRLQHPLSPLRKALLLKVVRPASSRRGGKRLLVGGGEDTTREPEYPPLGDTIELREPPKASDNQAARGNTPVAGVMTLGTVTSSGDAPMDNPQRSVLASMRGGDERSETKW